MPARGVATACLGSQVYAVSGDMAARLQDNGKEWEIIPAPSMGTCVGVQHRCTHTPAAAPPCLALGRAHANIATPGTSRIAAYAHTCARARAHTHQPCCPALLYLCRHLPPALRALPLPHMLHRAHQGRRILQSWRWESTCMPWVAFAAFMGSRSHQRGWSGLTLTRKCGRRWRRCKWLVVLLCRLPSPLCLGVGHRVEQPP